MIRNRDEYELTKHQRDVLVVVRDTIEMTDYQSPDVSHLVTKQLVTLDWLIRDLNLELEEYERVHL